MKRTYLLCTFFLFFALSILNAQNTYVPDDFFELALIDLGYDSGELNDSVPTNNIKSIINLTLRERMISDLTGIEDFVSLENLDCAENNIDNLDVQQNKNLKSLDCTSNQIADLDVSKNLKLILLYCGLNQLTTLDVSHNSALTVLWCYYNNLTSLNLESNLALKELFCHQNKIEELDVSKNVNLEDIWCYANNLRRLNLKNGNNYYMDVKAYSNPNLFCIQVDNPILSGGYSSWREDEWASYSEDCDFTEEITYIPDDNFEQALIDLGYDSGELNDSVPTANIDKITFLDISKKNIFDLEGIESFIKLDSLICYSNQITELDLKENINLTHLDCGDNNLTSLNLESNAKLKNILCYSNKLTILDVSSNIFLQALHCGGNQITSLDVSNNTNLEKLRCYFNQLSDLNVVHNIYLTELWCGRNNIENLDVSSNTNLSSLDCNSNSLTNINVKNNSELNFIDVSSNNIDYLDLRNNPLLKNLGCQDNNIHELNLSKNTLLQLLICWGNQISDLDISSNTSLIAVYCYGNSLTFNDIEPFFSLPSYPNFSSEFVYSPQSIIGRSIDTLVYKNQNIELTIDDYIPGPSDRYQWYKNGNVISGATSPSLNLDTLKLSDAGKYFCKITNSIATELTLNSREITLDISESIKGAGVPLSEYNALKTFYNSY